MDRTARALARNPALLLLFVFAITALALSQIVDLRRGVLHLRLDPSLERLLPEHDESRVFYETMRRMFGNDDVLVLAVLSDDLFSHDQLERVRALTRRIEEMDGVHHVVSLSTALNIRSVNGDIEIEPFLTDVPEDPAGLARIRSEALGNPIYSGNLVSPDGRATAIVVYLNEMSGREFLDREIDTRILEIAREESGSATVRLAGPPHVKAETSRTLLSDLTFVVPAAFATAALVSLVAFRSVAGLVIPMASILVALIWTLGAMAWSGRPLNIVTTIVPPLILSVGLAYSMHLMSEYYAVAARSEDGTRDRVTTVALTLSEIGLPVLLTGLTTVGGFLSLTLSPIQAIAEFGIFATIGVIASLVVSLTLGPALLRIFARPSSAARSEVTAIDRLAESLARFDLKQRPWILATSGLALAIAFLGMTRIEVSNDLITNFPLDAPVRRDFRQINEALGGSNPFSVIVEAGYRDAFQDPENLRILERLQRWLDSQPEIGSTTSVVDYVKLIHRGFRDDDPAALVIPETETLTAQLLYFGANDEIENFADSRYQTARILVRSNVIDSGQLRALVQRIEAELTRLPPRLQARVTGSSVLVASTIDDIAEGQLRSLGLATLVIYALLVALFTSFKVGLVALVPNMMPVVIYFGALGFSGVPLSATTALVACIVLGIAVDDTIHYLTRFNSEARRLLDSKIAAMSTLRAVARPVTFTSAALCLGFLTLTLSDLASFAHFGSLAAFTLAIAWVIDLTLTPALCSGLRIATLWDALSLDLGSDPQHSIPVFAGLSRAEARIAVLMTALHEVKAGERVIHRGDSGSDMYVVIDGELEASLSDGAGRRVLATHRRGDAVGEIGLLWGTRTADVDAVRNARLMRLTRGNLEGLSRRYPLIGGRIYRNIGVILAERLARENERAP